MVSISFSACRDYMRFICEDQIIFFTQLCAGCLRLFYGGPRIQEGLGK